MNLGHGIVIWNRFCVTVCGIFSVCVLFRYSVKLGIFDNLLLVVLSYGQHVLIFNVSLNVFNIDLPWTIVAHFAFVAFLSRNFLYIYFWLFTLIVHFLFALSSWPNWWWLISLRASLCLWNATSNRISTNLRWRSLLLILIFFMNILVWIVSARLCDESFVASWIFMLLTFIADIIITYIFLYRYRISSLTEEIIILLNKMPRLGSFMRIFLRFHHSSLVSTSRIDLAIKLPDILWLGIRPILLHTFANS